MDAINQLANAAQKASKAGVEAGLSFAHQIRDLLTVLLGSLEQLREQSLDEQGRHQLARAEVAVERAADLLNHYAPLSDPGQQDGREVEEPQ